MLGFALHGNALRNDRQGGAVTLEQFQAAVRARRAQGPRLLSAVPSCPPPRRSLAQSAGVRGPACRSSKPASPRKDK
eukprot:1747163-Pyramimonas_sp.AAC.1